MHDVSDAQLIKDHLGGDKRSLELLFALHLRPIFSFVARMVGDTTEVSKFTEGGVDDIETGKTVMVTGKADDDGSVTASSIQIRPAMPGAPSEQPAK